MNIRRIFKPYTFAQLYFFAFGIPNNSFGSVDVTGDCNLRCSHCYFFEQEQQPELSIEQWKDRFERSKADGVRFYQCSWVGGEPLLRQPLIELGRSYFKFNTVTTNGSILLPDWKDVSWYISVDGGRQTHDTLRNRPGLYDTIKQTIDKSEGLKITIAYCITRANISEIDAALDEWSINPKVRNLLFSFYTPIRGLDDDLWLDWDEKDQVLDAIIRKKGVFGDFILNTERSLRLMKSGRAKAVTDNCPFAEKSFAYDPAGNLKQPCMMGPKADCSRCGCVVPFYLKSLIDRRLIVGEMMKGMLKTVRQGMASIYSSLI